MQRTVILFLLILIHGFCIAQQTPDTSQVVIRNFNPRSIQAYKEDPAFQYDMVNGPSPSAWDRFWRWVWNKIGRTLSKASTAEAIRTCLIIAASVLLVYFGLRLAGMNNMGIFGKKNKGESLQYSTSDENIHAINFSHALQQAIENENFRLAIRLLYLQSLKNLSDLSLINWQINKTNSTYVDELKDPAQQRDFYVLTRQFENNWYGNMPIPENEFALVRKQFEQFNSQLK